MPGPPPKRSNQRRRRNKPVDIASEVSGCGSPPAPPELDPDWHPMARDWFIALRHSGQGEHYQASDWQTARVAAEILSRQLLSGRPSAQMMKVWSSLATALLATEGDRRRARLELQRSPKGGEGGEAASVSWIGEARRGLPD